MFDIESIQYPQGLNEIIAKYDTVVLDQWGVLHNGYNLYSGVLECLEKMHNLDIQIMMLSNSGRRSQDNRLLIERLGIPTKWVSEVMTSGEALWLNFHTHQALPEGIGTKALIISADKDYRCIEQTPIQIAKNVDDADFILLAGIDPRIADMQALLEQAIQKQLYMICSNPDLSAININGYLKAPGYWAKYYQSLGGKCSYYGKPYPLVYEHIKRLIKPTNKKVLMIGDSIHHDILGGKQAGFETLLLTQGVHANMFQNVSLKEGMQQLIKNDSEIKNQLPDAVMSGLFW